MALMAKQDLILLAMNASPMLDLMAKVLGESGFDVMLAHDPSVLDQSIQQSIPALIILGEGEILTATENGYGKRTRVDEFSPQGRGGMGVIAIQTSERNGRAVGAVQVAEGNQIMLITDGGTLVRTPVAQVSIVGRNTQGVTLIRLNEGEKLVQVAPILTTGDEDAEIDPDADVDGGLADVAADVTSAPDAVTE